MLLRTFFIFEKFFSINYMWHDYKLTIYKWIQILQILFSINLAFVQKSKYNRKTITNNNYKILT